MIAQDSCSVSIHRTALKITHFLIVIAFAITSPFGYSAEAHCEETRIDKIKLGVIVPLSGPLAFFGTDYIRAYELAVEKRPELKNVIEIIWEDSAYDSKKAIDAFTKLTAVDKSDLVLSFGGPMLSVLAPIAERYKVPFFATESAKKDCEKRAFCTLLRNEENEWGEATWNILRAQNKKRIGIIKNQNQFMNTFVNSVIATKQSDETVEILVDVPPDTTELKTHILKVKNRDFDALGVYLLPGSHRGFLSASAMLKPNVFLFGVEEFLVEENNRGFSEFTNNARVVAPWTTDAYRGTFESKYGYSAGFFYTPAFYDFMNLLGDTLRHNQKLRGIELVKALRFSGTREGVSGRYRVKVSEAGVHSVSFPIAVYKVVDGKTETEQVYEF